MSDAMIKYLENDLEIVQEFMDKSIVDGGSMTASSIYSGVCDYLSRDINEATFRSSLSANIIAGNITGFIGKKRIGYVKSDGSEVVRSTNSEKNNNTDEDKFSIQLTKNLRVGYIDTHNFGVKKYNGSVWMNIAYQTTMGAALKSALRILLKEKIKDESGIHDVKEAISVFEKIESSIMGEMINKTDGFLLEKKASEVA